MRRACDHMALYFMLEQTYPMIISIVDINGHMALIFTKRRIEKQTETYTKRRQEAFDLAVVGI